MVSTTSPSDHPPNPPNSEPPPPSPRSTPINHAQPKIPIPFKGLPETMLATLKMRAQDATDSSPTARYLNDIWAQPVLDKLDYPPAKEHIGAIEFVLLRAKQFDDWTREFLTEHASTGEGVTVLHLACGLDSRCFRVGCFGSGELDGREVGGEDGRGWKVRWVDVDLPEVVRVREMAMSRPLEASGREYRLLAKDVREDKWLEEEIPVDRPTLVIMEGLLMYLERSEVERLIRRICDCFPKGGQIIADVLGKRFIAGQERAKAIHRTGAVMLSSVDYAETEIVVLHEKLKLRDQLRLWQREGIYIVPWKYRLLVWVWSWIPGFSTMSSDLRMDF
ncbi:S-adenosyl-L-methionine-dependent methyltransferase [Podospora aff. communis PSN243]|uniref:S-adenosyl-L-methionine-dependent methyltransferase n=1 Tax=Podospora aff. communis PSN243 TaxID=3040156 RepID=A0AAV9GLV9_9PEZI|nr:S-adenosyl-L-methionine-dependent methyltransferase [Podospora aff. communis PSN243]